MSSTWLSQLLSLGSSRGDFQNESAQSESHNEDIMEISRNYSLLPVTAICSCYKDDESFLIGEGPFVKVFSREKPKLQVILQVFESQAIHGIVSIQSFSHNESSFIVFGGRQLCLVDLVQVTDGHGTILRKKSAPIIEHSDWILDARVWRDGNTKSIEVLFLDAHNDLFICNIDGSTVSLFSRGPPSALYSGSIEITSTGKVLVAAGTVFGEVHLWSVRSSSETVSRKLVQYSGHEGSVFDVRISRLPGTHGVRHVITSCSDDRTVKIWEIPSDLQSMSTLQSTDEQQTGFDRENVDQKSIAPVAQDIAHVSRIWRVSTFSLPNNVNGLVSFGEDATAQIWSLIESEGGSSFLSKDHSLNLHTGKNIWAGEVISSGAESYPMFASGGADGRITLTNLSKWNQRHALTQDLQEIEQKDEDSDSLRGYCWLDSSLCLAVSATGGIHISRIDERSVCEPARWQHVSTEPDLARYCLMSSIDAGYAIIAGGTGSVFVYSVSNQAAHRVLNLKRKVSFVHATLHEDEGCPAQATIVIACLGSAQVYLKTIEMVSDNDNTSNTNLNTYQLPLAFVVTSALLLANKFLVLGSRNGRLAVYSLNDTNATGPQLVLDDVHGRETVTKIIQLHADQWIATTGRDGSFRVHRIIDDSPDVSIKTVSTTKLPFGPDIEGVEVVNDHLYVWGFRGTDFVLWNHTIQQELFSIDCGGQHRSWSFFNGFTSSLAWTRAGKPYVAQLRPMSRVAQLGTHGREIKALAIRNYHDDELGQMIATGAEDTCIRLSKYDDPAGYSTLAVMPDHTTGLQKLFWSGDGQYLFSAAGKEEFLVWKIQSVPVLGVGVMKVGMCPAVTDTQILRIMDFDFVVDRGVYTIAMVYSDSSIRVWSFDSMENEFELLREATYSSRCITQCKIHNEDLLTASTDGFLTLWNLEDLSQISQKRVHQSSVKSLDIVGRDEWIFIATGGDDNAIGLTMLDFSSPPIWQSLLIPKAHAAAVNAVSFLSWYTGALYLATASNDQRLKIWEIHIEDITQTPKLHVFRHSNLASPVADASCIALLVGQEERVMVAGVGVEIFGTGRVP